MSTPTYTQTTNLLLNKPAGSDLANIPGIYNDNMDKIDAGVVLKQQSASDSGKFLVINSSGVVTPTTVPSANGVSF